MSPQTLNTPKPPPGFIPEQPTGAIAPPPPGFVPEKQPKWAVQAPDGKVIQFPDNFTDVDVTREMNKMYPIQGQGGPNQTGGGLNSLVVDPQFLSLQPSDQRKALAGVSRDDTFSTLSDDDTGRYIKAHQAILSQNTTNQSLSKASGISAQPKPFTLPWLKQGAWRAAASTADAAPGIGATLGGMAGFAEGGPPGAIGGAGIGGTGGAGLQQIMRRFLGYKDVPQTSGAAAQDMTKQGATQAAIQAGTELLPFLAGPIRRSAVANYEDVLNPTKQATKYQTQQIMPQLLEERPIALTRKGLAEKAAGQAEQAGQQIEQTVSGLQGRMNTQPVIDGLQNLKKSYQVNGVSLRPEVDNAIDAVSQQMQAMGPDISLQDAVKARRILDQAVAEAKGYQGAQLSDSSMAAIRKETANSIRSELGRASPDLAALNSKFHFWNTLSDVMDQTIQRKTGQVNALPKMEAVIAGAGGLAQSGVPGATEAGSAMWVLGKVVRSTGWRTVSAATKGAIADALANRQFDTAVGLLARTGLVGAALSQSDDSTK